jgi:hypothetical protein
MMLLQIATRSPLLMANVMLVVRIIPGLTRYFKDISPYFTGIMSYGYTNNGTSHVATLATILAFILSLPPSYAIAQYDFAKNCV